MKDYWKKYLKKIILVIISTTISTPIFAATITSNPAGGNWFQPNTWIGNKVPTENDNVIIQSLVQLSYHQATVQNLTVTTNGTLQPYQSLGSKTKTITIKNSLINNGNIRAQNNQKELSLRFQGTTINNQGQFGVVKLWLGSQSPINVTAANPLDAKEVHLENNTTLTSNSNFAPTTKINGHDYEFTFADDTTEVFTDIQRTHIKGNNITIQSRGFKSISGNQATLKPNTYGSFSSPISAKKILCDEECTFTSATITAETVEIQKEAKIRSATFDAAVTITPSGIINPIPYPNTENLQLEFQKELENNGNILGNTHGKFDIVSKNNTITNTGNISVKNTTFENSTIANTGNFSADYLHLGGTLHATGQKIRGNFIRLHKNLLIDQAANLEGNSYFTPSSFHVTVPENMNLKIGKISGNIFGKGDISAFNASSFSSQDIQLNSEQFNGNVTAKNIRCEKDCTVFGDSILSADTITIDAEAELNNNTTLNGELIINPTGKIKPAAAGGYRVLQRHATLNGDIKNNGEVSKGYNYGELYLSIFGNIQNQNIWDTKKTHLHWTAPPTGKTSQIRFAPTYNNWETPIDTATNQYQISPQANENTYWQYRYKTETVVPGADPIISYSDWSRVYQINTPTGRTVTTPTANIIADKTIWQESKNPRIFLNINSSERLINQKIFYKCKGSICQSDIVMTETPNEYVAEIDANTILDDALEKTETPLEYWVEIEDEYGETAPIGNEQTPETLLQTAIITSGGSGRSSAPPSVITNATAITCGKTILAFPKPDSRYEIKNYRLWHGDTEDQVRQQSNEISLSNTPTETKNSIQIELPTETKISEYIGITSTNQYDEESGISNITMLQKFDTCTTKFDLEADFSELDTNDTIHWKYDFQVFEDALQNIKTGESLQLYLKNQQDKTIMARELSTTPFMIYNENTFPEKVSSFEKKSADFFQRYLEIRTKSGVLIARSDLEKFTPNPTPKETRAFKTSIPNITIRSEANTNSEKVFVIGSVNTDITVTGTAIAGQYIDAYKTDRWYPVEYVNGDEIYKGFVIATVIRPEFIELDLLDSGDRFNYWESTFPEVMGIKKAAIILHFTGNYASAKNERDNMNKPGRKSKTSSHYVIDKDGSIIQPVLDFDTAHHAFPDNERSIGIEIVNVGPVKFNKSKNGWFSSARPNYQINEENIIDVSLEHPDIWDIWKRSDNHTGQTEFGSKEPYWERYSNEQIESLKNLISIITEKIDIKQKTFDQYPIPKLPEVDKSTDNKYNIYYTPLDSVEWSTYQALRKKFNGIYFHHNVSKKYDAGPHLNIFKHLFK